MHRRTETVSDVLHVLGVGFTGGTLVLAIPAVIGLLSSTSPYAGAFWLVVVLAMLTMGGALLLSGRVLHKVAVRGCGPSPLLAGLARCAFCRELLPASSGWYGEASNTHNRACPQGSLMARADLLDLQIGEIFHRMVLPPAWTTAGADTLASLRARIFATDERTRIGGKERQLSRLYTERKISEGDYQFEKNRLDLALVLASLTVPRGLEPAKAGETLHRLLGAWNQACPEERVQILTSVLDGVYCDLEAHKVIALKPKNEFLPFFALSNGLSERERVPFWTSL